MSVLIKDVLNKLPANSKQQLMYAFQHQLPQFVELPDGKYVGVHTNSIKHLVPEIVVNNWTYGTIKKGSNIKGE